MPLKKPVVFQLVEPVFSMCLPPFPSEVRVTVLGLYTSWLLRIQLRLSVVLPDAWGLINLIISDFFPLSFWMWHKLPEFGTGTKDHLYLGCYIPLITNSVIFFFFTGLRLYASDLIYLCSFATIITCMSLGMIIIITL